MKINKYGHLVSNTFVSKLKCWFFNWHQLKYLKTNKWGKLVFYCQFCENKVKMKRLRSERRKLC